jgi:hypothetical protein
MAHLPPANLFVFTDGANLSHGRPGTWLEPALPAKVRFSRAQLKAKGYTIHWIKAQYRFIQALQLLGSMAQTGVPVRAVHWVVVLDDDTFVDVRAMARLLHNYDMRGLRLLAANKTRRSSSPAGPAADPQASSMPAAAADGAAAAVDADAPSLQNVSARRADMSDAAQLAAVSAHRAHLRMTYLGDRGWGGAGHFLNYAAATYFAARSDECVDHYMVQRFLASDETLKKCLPRLGGIQIVNERLLSHCQGYFLRRRLLTGDHVSVHAKRDFVLPRKFAIWRLRLYYQVMYHRNLTAYRWMQTVGACAYGYSCKIKSCGEAHDREAMQIFLNLSANGSFVPLV